MPVMAHGDVTVRGGRLYVSPTWGGPLHIIPRLVMDSLPHRPRDGELVWFRAATAWNGQPCVIDLRLPRRTRHVRHDDVATPLGNMEMPDRGSSHPPMPVGTLVFAPSGRAYVRPDRGGERFFVPGFVLAALRSRLRAGDRVRFRPDRGRNGAPCTLDVRPASGRP